jgi:hypothetical protein
MQTALPTIHRERPGIPPDLIAAEELVMPHPEPNVDGLSLRARRLIELAREALEPDECARARILWAIERRLRREASLVPPHRVSPADIGTRGTTRSHARHTSRGLRAIAPCERRSGNGRSLPRNEESLPENEESLRRTRRAAPSKRLARPRELAEPLE